MWRQSRRKSGVRSFIPSSPSILSKSVWTYNGGYSTDVNVKRVHILPDGPMSRKMHEEVEEDPTFLKRFHEAQSEPRKKYTRPMTTSQEIGWISNPLIAADHKDRRLNFRRHKSEITKHMEAAWRLKEKNQNR
ncbi:protein FAM183A isoform X2 [Ictalurus furcatus]|uniref:protein FAM183A isoform X2 n=1 Tax=Ictalurus furcatus TaxID=66913 RepID=UPI00234FFC6D|nr:protein FAM183A isoform X2 [Ictalurus furcatus]